MQVRTQVLTCTRTPILKCSLILFTLVVARSSFGREFQNVGAVTIKALSPNVVFDQTAGIESKILPEDLRLYKDALMLVNRIDI